MARTSSKDLENSFLYKAVLAELLGTFFLVLVGCGSCSTFPYEATIYNNTLQKEVVVIKKDPGSLVQIAFSFGLAVASIVWAIVHVSGGHINPAVSIAFFATRKISLIRLVLYLGAQIGGAIAGAYLLGFLTPTNVNDSICSTLLNDAISWDKGLLIEFLITFVLVWTVFATCDINRTKMSGSGPLAVGLSVTVCHLWAVSWHFLSSYATFQFSAIVFSKILRQTRFM